MSSWRVSSEEAVAYARERMVPWMEALARQAGAAQVEVQMDRHDTRAPHPVGRGDKLYLGTRLTFTAVGQLSPATREEAV